MGFAAEWTFHTLLPVRVNPICLFTAAGSQSVQRLLENNSQTLTTREYQRSIGKDDAQLLCHCCGYTY